MLTRTLSLLARDVQIMAAGTFTIVKIIAMKLKNLILFVLNLLKRALCIFRRRTPGSPVLPVVLADTSSAVYDIPEVDNDAGSWDSWDAPAQDFQAQSSSSSYSVSSSHFMETQTVIAPQGQLQHSAGTDEDVEPEEPDYFADMTPATFKAPKIVVKKKSPHYSSSSAASEAAGDSAPLFSSRLAVSDNASDGLALAPPQELEEMDDWDNPMVEENMWADEENEELDWEVEFALRETRRQELERKKWEQQQRRLQREMQKGRTHSQGSSSSSHFQTIQSLTH